ncbi:MAG: shikimate kinase [Candidatus Thermoplasmatota archaeon]|nr:shikimate kinase [Candidatus Thermoplasmatota archaeon]MCL5799885.1 shikimate kinase [Candidatus Thermoplasmatota archaeon]
MSIISVNGGISVISAFANGIGSAVSIDLSMRIMSSRSGETPDPIVHDLASWYCDRFSLKEVPEISIHSRIPRGQGLKSSSALAIGILELLIMENGVSIPDEEKLSAAAIASKEHKLSATGAYDDLTAAYYGGLTLTDNNENKLYLRKEVPLMPVMIVYDPLETRSSYLLKDAFAETPASDIQTMAEKVKKGSFLPVAVMNGQIMGRKTGIRNDLIDQIRKFSPLAVSQSGKGPSIFAFFKNTIEMRKCAASLASKKGISIILSRTSNDPIQRSE